MWGESQAMRSLRVNLSFALIALLTICSGRAQAGSILGDPVSLFFSLKQGGTTIANVPVTFGPGGMLPDIRDISQDGTPESFVTIGTLPLGLGYGVPIILKVVAEDDPVFKLLHFYIDVPIATYQINTPGPFSLFNTADGAPIEVSITNATFAGGAFVIPQLFNTNSFFTSFMRDKAGHFYESPQTNGFNSYGHGVNDIQVPATAYLDGNPGQYNFAALPGPVSSWTWSNIPNPGPAGTTVHNGIAGGQPSNGNGYVFELGLSVAFTPIPEPTSLALLLPIIFIRRRRR
jgi:hypothetical protein